MFTSENKQDLIDRCIELGMPVPHAKLSTTLTLKQFIKKGEKMKANQTHQYVQQIQSHDQSVQQDESVPMLPTYGCEDDSSTFEIPTHKLPRDTFDFREEYAEDVMGDGSDHEVESSPIATIEQPHVGKDIASIKSRTNTYIPSSDSTPREVLNSSTTGVSIQFTPPVKNNAISLFNPSPRMSSTTSNTFNSKSQNSERNDLCTSTNFLSTLRIKFDNQQARLRTDEYIVPLLEKRSDIPMLIDHIQFIQNTKLYPVLMASFLDEQDCDWLALSSDGHPHLLANHKSSSLTGQYTTVDDTTSSGNPLVDLYNQQERLLVVLNELTSNRQAFINVQMGKGMVSLENQKKLLDKQARLNEFVTLANSKRVFVWNTIMTNVDKHHLFEQAKGVLRAQLATRS